MDEQTLNHRSQGKDANARISQSHKHAQSTEGSELPGAHIPSCFAFLIQLLTREPEDGARRSRARGTSSFSSGAAGWNLPGWVVSSMYGYLCVIDTHTYFPREQRFSIR